jgi:hypothetical protein
METLAKKSSGGPFQYWKDKLKAAKDIAELNQAGLQIKRAALEQLTEKEVDDLREIFKEKRAVWQSPEA